MQVPEKEKSCPYCDLEYKNMVNINYPYLLENAHVFPIFSMRFQHIPVSQSIQYKSITVAKNVKCRSYHEL